MVVETFGFVSECGPIELKETVSLPLWENFILPGLSGKIAAMSGAQRFFSRVSLRTLIPSMASAYIFSSSEFSLSKAFRRLASASLISPYFGAPHKGLLWGFASVDRMPLGSDRYYQLPATNRWFLLVCVFFASLWVVSIIKNFSLPLAQFFRPRSQYLVTIHLVSAWMTIPFCRIAILWQVLLFRFKFANLIRDTNLP